MMRLTVLGCAIFAATMATACSHDASGAKQGQERVRSVRLFDFIDAVLRLDRIDHAAVGTLFRRQLSHTESNEYFDRYRLDRLAIDDVLDAVAIDLREPRAGSGATAGSLLTMDIEGGCIDLATLRQRYGTLTITQTPRGRSPQEKTVHEIRAGTRVVRFGFTEANPACLGSLTIESAP